MFCYTKPNSVMNLCDIEDINYNVAMKRENIQD